MREAGFSLIELMVVVSIIGILSSMAVPRFQTFRARAIQSEAKSNLNGFFLAMEGYRANYNSYPQGVGGPVEANAVGGIGFALDGQRSQYRYRAIIEANGIGFAATARSIVPNTTGTYVDLKLMNNLQDVWRVNANKWLCAPVDSVRNTATNVNHAIKAASNATDCPQGAGTTDPVYYGGAGESDELGS